MLCSQKGSRLCPKLQNLYTFSNNFYSSSPQISYRQKYSVGESVRETRKEIQEIHLIQEQVSGRFRS